MKKFDFPLQKLLELRAAQLEAEEAKLHGLYGERNAVVRTARDLDEADQAASEEIAASATVSGDELADLVRFHEQVKRRLRALEERRQECEERIRKQRQKVLEADRAKQLLEKLKESRFEEWKYELNREIEATAGELFLARWKGREG